MGIGADIAIDAMDPRTGPVICIHSPERVLRLSPAHGRVFQLLQHSIKILLEMGRIREFRQVFVLFVREHDKAAKQATVDVGANILPVIVEGPHADRLFGDLERVRPCLTGADFIGTPAIVALRAERPRAIRIDTIANAVHVETMRRIVGVLDVNAQPIARSRVDDGARNTPCECWLVHIGGYELIRLRDQILGIQVLPIDQRRQPPRSHLIVWDRPVLVSHVAHAVSPVLDWR